MIINNAIFILKKLIHNIKTTLAYDKYNIILIPLHFWNLRLMYFLFPFWTLVLFHWSIVFWVYYFHSYILIRCESSSSHINSSSNFDRYFYRKSNRNIYQKIVVNNFLLVNVNEKEKKEMLFSNSKIKAADNRKHSP